MHARAVRPSATSPIIDHGPAERAVTMASQGNLVVAVETTARLSELISHLPAVATHDWCDRAAAVLANLQRDLYACIGIAVLDEHARIADFEAGGVGSATPGNASDRLSSLRSNLERLPSMGWSYVPDSPEPRVQFAADLSGSMSWHQGPLGKLWHDIDPADLVLGAIALGSASPGRTLFASIACREHIGWAAPVLRAILPLLARKALVAIGEERSNPSRWLTTKEQIILDQLALGKSVKAIAEALDRSPHTIHDHVKALHRKLQATSRGELIARALGHIDEQGRTVRPVGERAAPLNRDTE